MRGRLREEGGVLSDTFKGFIFLGQIRSDRIVQKDPFRRSRNYLRMPSFPMTVL
jgi:hypothetical protein